MDKDPRNDQHKMQQNNPKTRLERMEVWTTLSILMQKKKICKNY
jgi:hypothetical protein